MSRLRIPFAVCTAVLMSSFAANGAGVEFHGYYEDSKATTWTSVLPPTAGTCELGFSCFYPFTIVPRGKQLVVTNVSCNLSWSTDVNPAIAEIVQLDLIAMRGRTLGKTSQHLVPPKLGDGVVTDAKVIFNAQTQQLFTALQRPVLWIRTQTNSTFVGECTIAGRMFSGNG